MIEKNGAKVFVAGAIGERRHEHEDFGQASLFTSGGRVLAVCALAPTFDEAWKKAYAAMQGVKFDGIFYRKDIGLPGAAVSD